MINKVITLNLKVMAGYMTGSTIGISNLVQLAGLLNYMDADGAMLLNNDIATGVHFKNGHIAFSESDGSGVEIL